MAKPQVLVDGTVFEGRGRIGIWRLFYELISRTRQDVDYTILLASDPQLDLPSDVDVYRFRRGPELVTRRHAAWKWTRPLFHGPLRSRFAQHIWHPTFFSLDPRGNPADRSSPRRVATIYDMISEDFYWMGDFALQREMKRRCIQHSDHFIAISQATADRLSSYYPETRERITVIHLAADHSGQMRSGQVTSGAPAASRPTPKRLTLPEKFCLYVGGRSLYKNFPLVVQAMAKPEWPESLSLVVVGASFSPEEQSYIESHGVGGKMVSVGPVGDDLLRQCYGEADCFLFPSMGEGFGLPILEAQSRGHLPVLSDTAVFREVAGEAAFFHLPGDAEGLIRCVRQALETSGEQRNATAGANLDRFSWDRSAEKWVAVYESFMRAENS